MITVKKQKLKGIVIKQETYKEDSSKITLFTEDGLYNFIAKGTKKIESKLRPQEKSGTTANRGSFPLTTHI